MIPYSDLLDEESGLSAGRITEKLRLEEPVFPITELFINGLHCLRFSYYGGLLLKLLVKLARH